MCKCLSPDYKLKLKALMMNFDICARVTFTDGQYINGDAWQPDTTLALYTPSIKLQKILPDGTSAKISAHAAVEHEPGSTASIAKQINFAIACRSIMPSGQYINGDAEHPLTIPALYNASI